MSLALFDSSLVSIYIASPHQNVISFSDKIYDDILFTILLNHVNAVGYCTTYFKCILGLDWFFYETDLFFCSLFQCVVCTLNEQAHLGGLHSGIQLELD